MAKKQKNNDSKPLTYIPTAIAGLTGGGLSDITKDVNSNNLDPQKEKRQGEPTTPEQDIQSQKKTSHALGRPSKENKEIVDAVGETEWERFIDYTSQFHSNHVVNGTNVKISSDVKKFFEKMKLVCGAKADIQSMMNAALRLFMDKYKEEINERIRQSLS